jgi:2-oxoglutarate dehydrogenase E1 component
VVIDRGTMPLGEIYQRLQETYAGRIGFEYMHIPSVEQCNWLREKIETPKRLVYSKDTKIKIFKRLAWADKFERFCNKWGKKRFGLEGGESCIPGMLSILLITSIHLFFSLTHNGNCCLTNTHRFKGHFT